MSEAQVALVSGLGGALIGALAALGGQALAGWQQNRAERRRERIDLVSRFWAAADRLWVASESLVYTIMDQQASQQAGHRDALADINDRRMREIAERREAAAEARFLLGQMRLLYPAIAATGQALLKASGTFSHNTAEEDREARAAALEAFETVAIKALSR